MSDFPDGANSNPLFVGRVLSGFREFADHTEMGFYTEEHLRLEHVIYRKRPPKVNVFQRLIHKFRYSEEEDHYDVPLQLPAEASRKEEEKIGLVKYSDWRYEREIRAFYPVNESSQHPDLRLLSVSQEHLAGLVFGRRMTSRDKQRAVFCCHLMRQTSFKSQLPNTEQLPEFVFFQAKQQANSFEVDIQPVGILEHQFSPWALPLTKLSELDEASQNRLRQISRQLVSDSVDRGDGVCQEPSVLDIDPSS